MSSVLCDQVAQHQFVKLPDGRLGKVNAMTPNQFNIRILWLPAYVSDDVIREGLERQAPVRVNRIDFEEDRDGFRNNNRRVNVTCADRESIPLVVSFIPKTDNRAINGLCSVPGKQVQCLRCYQRGHLRKDCNVKMDDETWCMECRKDAGHSTSGHMNSWAARARAAINGASSSSSEVPVDVVDANTETQAGFTFRKSVQSVIPNTSTTTPPKPAVTPTAESPAPAAKPDGPPAKPDVQPPTDAAQSTSADGKKMATDDILSTAASRTDGSDDVTQGEDELSQNSPSQSLLAPSQSVKRKELSSDEFDSPDTSNDETPKPNQEAEKKRLKERMKERREGRRRKYNEMSQDAQNSITQQDDSQEWKSTEDDNVMTEIPEGVDPLTGEVDWSFSPNSSRPTSPSPPARPKSPDDLLD